MSSSTTLKRTIESIESKLRYTDSKEAFTKVAVDILKKHNLPYPISTWQEIVGKTVKFVDDNNIIFFTDGGVFEIAGSDYGVELVYNTNFSEKIPDDALQEYHDKIAAILKEHEINSRKNSIDMLKAQREEVDRTLRKLEAEMESTNL